MIDAARTGAYSMMSATHAIPLIPDNAAAGNARAG